MPEVTDQELLKQLGASEPGEVTDPELLKQLEGGESSAFGGYLKSIGRGIKKGLTDFALSPGYAEQEQMNAAGTGDKMEGVPNPAEVNAAMGPSEHPLVESVFQGLGNPAAWIGPGGPVSKTIANVAGTLGGEAGAHMAKGSAYEIPAQLAGSYLAGHAATTIPSRIPAPFKNIDPKQQAMVDALKSEGVTSLTAGQQRGSKGLKYAESILGDSLFSGTGSEEINDAQKAELTGNLIKRMGETSGETAATPDVIESARQRIGDKMDEVAKKLPITFDKKFGDRLAAIEKDLTDEGLAPEQVNRITKNIENVRNAFITKSPSGSGLAQTIAQMRANQGAPVPANLSQAMQQGVAGLNAAAAGSGTPKGIMPGKAYQMLTRKDTPLDRLMNSQNPDERFYGGRLRDALDEAMWRSANARGTRAGTGRRQAAQDLLEARRQWRTMVMVSKAVAGGGEDAAKGYVTPAQLRQALTSTPQDKLRYARSHGPDGLNDLSRAANAVMTPLPNSGTGQRNAVMEMFHLAPTLLGAEGAAGATAGGLVGGLPGALAGAAMGPVAAGVAGRALHSRPVQNYLTNQLPGQKWVAENRPGASPAWLSMVNVLRGQQ